ncbi:MAG: pimeloyl-ACP methyl ester carboxylesterase [Candidatus Poriferisodalaceae bacterium]|jgi:pimeloyl-ACP methyl ester carboxylesterase
MSSSHAHIQPVARCFGVSEGLSLAADVWGNLANPTVLMLHGAGQNRHAWKGSAAKLVILGWSVVTVDARGHGDSDWSPEQHYDSDHLAVDFRCILNELAAEQPGAAPPAVVGASMGGMASLSVQRLAGSEQAFSAVVLVDITPNFDPSGALRVVRFMSANPDGFADLDEAADAIADYNPHRPRPADSGGLAKVLRQRDDGRWIWRWDPSYITAKPGMISDDDATIEQHMLSTRDTMYAGAHAVGVPMLLVRGSQSDLVTPEGVAEFMAEVPGVEFVDVAGTGHMVAGDDNDAFTAAVSEFLTRVYPAATEQLARGGAGSSTRASRAC